MARNGSGTYARVEGPYVYNTIIDQVEVNAELDDIATALTNSLTKNGETTATANQPMGTYRHTGVGNGVARTDYAAAGQVQDGTLNWVDGGGTADAITATYSPAITALVDGQICCVRATAANATTTPTFAPNGLTARTIVKTGGVALVAGDIVGDGHELLLRYLLASTRWELLNPAINAANALKAGSASQAFSASALTVGTLTGVIRGDSGVLSVDTDVTDIVSAASDTAAGKVELATSAETITGTDTARAVTPAGVKAALGASIAITYLTPLSATYHDFTIPTGAKRVTLNFGAMSTDGSAMCLVQIGNGTPLGSGYAGSGASQANGGTLVVTANSNGFNLEGNSSLGAAATRAGRITFELLVASNHTWACSGLAQRNDSLISNTTAGYVTLTNELTVLRLTTANGTDAFDGGSASVYVE